jgi:hypothetical protein
MHDGRELVLPGSRANSGGARVELVAELQTQLSWKELPVTTESTT